MAAEAEQLNTQMLDEIHKNGSKKLRRLTRRVLSSPRHAPLSFETLNEVIRLAERKWMNALDTAMSHDTTAGYHDIRIKTKTMRYAVELVARFVEIAHADTFVEWLKSIQDELGEWHDDVEECRRITELLSNNADCQSDTVANNLIRSLKERTEAHTQVARGSMLSLRSAIYKRTGRSLFHSGKKNGTGPALEVVALGHARAKVT